MLQRNTNKKSKPTKNSTGTVAFHVAPKPGQSAPPNNLSTRRSKYRESLAATKSAQISGHELFLSTQVPDLTDEDRLYMSPEELEDAEFEWLAENTVDFFNEVEVMLEMLSYANSSWEDACESGLLENNGYPPNRKYLWKMHPRNPPEELPVRDYIEVVLEWIKQRVMDEDIFPMDEDTEFPGNFRKIVEKIMQRLFRVFAIVYSNPLLSGIKEGKRENQQIVHLKRVFKHFMYFCWEWELISNKETDCIYHVVDPLYRSFEKDRED
eukprot:maker-scaffold_37-snap-gene-0.31-mRNA-1 protein AED:0.00 eAED:0.00 QI:34/1/1/1/0/0/2/131/266